MYLYDFHDTELKITLIKMLTEVVGKSLLIVI